MPLSLSEYVEQESERCLLAYAANPKLVREHAGIEAGIIYGGYGNRQIFELIQNGADAMLASPGRIELVLTDSALYCANEGAPIDCSGADVLLSSSISNKRGDEIGRFGMGFKSVLGLTQSPAFFSSTGCFRFSRPLAERRIRQVCPDAEDVPILRIAEALDSTQSLREDDVLRELSSWATTVVRLPFTHTPDWLHSGLREFPAEFLLFSPHVRRLTLTEKWAGGAHREIEAERMTGTEVLLVEQQRYVTWKVFSTVVEPTEAALKDAGERSGRKRIPISWAVPTVRHDQVGMFWSFFPTTLKTSLSGILNAPWKTNEDRLNLLPGPFNHQLLEASAELVVKSLPELLRADDPGALLDVLPGRESRGWADERLATEVYKLAAPARIVPDQDGKLASVGKLKLPPDALPGNALELWNSASHRPKGWTHASLEKLQRRSRLDRLAGGKAAVGSVRSWLEALVTDGHSSDSVVALECAAALEKASFAEHDIRTARIVPTTAGEWVAPVSQAVFFPGSYTAISDSTEFVDHSVAANPRARAALLSLNIREADPIAELKAMLLDGMSSYSNEQWRYFWQVVEAIGDAAIPVLRTAANEGSLRVATRAGSFEALMCTLLPGPIATESEDDSAATIDVVRHAGHLNVLRSIGAVDSIKPDYALRFGGVMEAYRRSAVETYKGKMKSSPRDRADLQFQTNQGVGPLDVFDRLSEESRLRFTEAALGFEPESWHLRNVRQPKLAPLHLEASPCTWLLRKRGVLQSSFGVRRTVDTYSSRLEDVALYFPVAKLAHHLSDRLALRTTPSMTEVQRALDSALDSEDEEVPIALYVFAAAAKVPAPAEIRCHVNGQSGRCALSKVVLMRATMLPQLTRPDELAYLAVDEAAMDVLSANWKLQILDIAVDQPKMEVEPGDRGAPVPLFDRFPSLQSHTLDPLALVSCTSLIVREITQEGDVIEPRRFVREGPLAYYLESLPEEELWAEVCLNLNPPLGDLLQYSLRPQTSAASDNERSGPAGMAPQKIDAVARAATLAEKLLIALGEAALRRRLPNGLHEAVVLERGVLALTPQEVAEVALAVHGSEALQVHRSELEEAGFRTPNQWGGSVRARDFVRRLGFPESFAGVAAPTREPLLSVPGRRKLPELHGYQESVVREMQKVFVGDGGYRAFVSLPTGAGKTRVTVEGLIRGIVSGVLSKPILWVAQQDELCEQAIQTWRDAWPALGNDRTLHLSRLWGNNRIVRVDGQQVIVATISKLDWIMKDPSYEWLRGVGALVIDEAHTSITPSYTSLLLWAGFGRTREDDAAPLLGLSATPERGNEAESQRLVERYNRRRLDTGAFEDGDAYEVLQTMGVLARVEQECIDGTCIVPAEADLEQFRIFKRLTPDLEERIGRDAKRNHAILSSIARKPKEWPILVFAASVEHAELLAALLTLAGISAACITGSNACWCEI